MLYIINNCERFPEDRQLFFVEAPEGFSEWFATEFQPWQRDLIARLEGRAWFQIHEIICVAPSATYPGSVKPISVDLYLARNSFATRKIGHQAPRFQALTEPSASA